MKKLDLKNVTLACIDDIDPRTASEVISSLSSRISFADIKLFSSKNEKYATDKLSPIKSLTDYSVFAINKMPDYIDSEFCMMIQRDGYPLNFAAWLDEYLKYDYVGAPWIWAPIQSREDLCPIGNCVGNGGFSIRSKKLMDFVKDYNYDGFHEGAKRDEDEFICRDMGEDLKSKGVKFAPAELACFFSVENKLYTGQFGFHGSETIKLNKKLGIFKFERHAYEHEHQK